VNHELVAALNRAGARAVGLSGIDAYLAEAEQLNPALGWVGRVTRCNPEVLHLLVKSGYIPIVACVGGDRQGNIYNVNADQMAVACATAYGAERLVFLTDVEGVMDANQRILPLLTTTESRGLIASGIATSGMRAKLEAAMDALRQGVGKVCIAPGKSERVLDRIVSGEPVGTQLCMQEAQTA
jgi:acetylglutamate kinase